ncbi:hypothetical protein D8B26_007010 [Coccidioides posadasii str. Silveira]|uniref:Uncharacterized protein n=1 Tax=Coccidioides posadasii (strain RMSCC 757 / Silveira) TaxID=443226 RepID=E9DGE7_COCPS|nr:conserved hypothetical protein [Coccidioides posadasii str. Silveira]QVM12380.1 hypothetical protein D8B26_007010 [Coccidioides posadasii str. Silveira]
MAKSLDDSDGSGTLGFNPPFSFGTGSDSGFAILFELAALIPLVTYLARPQEGHRFVGMASLSGRLQIGLFPKLHVLATVARLLKEGPNFLDEACSIGELRREVWDANWGSVFPCANGAASSMIAAYSVRQAKTIAMPETVVAKTPNTTKRGVGNIAITPSSTSPFRRYQTLHVLRFSREEGPGHPHRAKTITVLQDVVVEVILLGMLAGATAFCSLFGMYGTAGSIIVAFLLRICRRLVIIKRAPHYLQDNEGQRMDACMLSAIHQNASTWYLYVGDRGIVDNLLNKSMIQSITTIFGDGGVMTLAFLLQFLSFLQLACMTFVAAQKGWDGVGLLVFIFVSWFFEEMVCCSHSGLAKRWLKKNRIKVEPRTFVFSGRVAMMGAIQVFKCNPQMSWMDGIIQPCPRRNVLMQGLCGYQDAYCQGLAELDMYDQKWVEQFMSLCQQAGDIMHQEFTNAQNVIRC